MTYSYSAGTSVARGLNLNAPSAGLRPDRRSPTSSKSCRTPQSRQHQLQVDATSIPARSWRFIERRVHQLEALHGVRQLLAGQAHRQHRRRLLPAVDRRSQRRVGAGGERRPESPQRPVQQSDRPELLVGFWSERDQRRRLHRAAPAATTTATVFNDRPAGIGRNTLRMTVAVPRSTPTSATRSRSAGSGAAAARLRRLRRRRLGDGPHHRTVERPLSR